MSLFQAGKSGLGPISPEHSRCTQSEVGVSCPRSMSWSVSVPNHRYVALDREMEEISSVWRSAKEHLNHHHHHHVRKYYHHSCNYTGREISTGGERVNPLLRVSPKPSPPCESLGH